jgi:exoribonuclease-2
LNVFYEEDGGFKVGHVLTENDASYQVEAAHGKRSKIKAANVLLKFERPGLAEFLPLAEAEASGLDLDFLWDVAPREEFGADGMANEYYGRAPTAVESAALIMRLHGAPIYFHKKGKGRYKAAPEEALKAALASVERKKREAELQARYTEQLVRFEVPAELAPQMLQLLYAPDKQAIGFKALESACAQTALSAPVLLHRAGVLASAYDYYLGRFLHENFPERLGGRGFPEINLEEALAPTVSGGLADIPPSDNGPAFSIDDSATTEIDDALSVKPVRDGVTRVGIHIAAPGLGFAPDSPVDVIARRRLSTVYMPGDKITMLPDAVVERFTLVEGRRMPAVSLYLDVNQTDGTVIATRSCVDTIEIAANLRHDVLDAEVTQANLESGGGDFPFKPELQFLWRFANALEKVRGKPSTAAHMRDFSFRVDWDKDRHVSIGERKRGAPLDKIVSELMIHANSTWGKLLADRGAAGIYRVKTGVGIQGKVRMTSAPAPHIGLGVTHYAWSSSPLRRYVDLVNQWQLIAVLPKGEGEAATTPPFAAKSEMLLSAIAAFDAAYTAYAEFQDTMERYWCMRWLVQEGRVRPDDASGALPGTVMRDGVVRLDELPLRLSVAGLPALPQGARVAVQVRAVDEWRLAIDAAFAGVIDVPAAAAEPAGTNVSADSGAAEAVEEDDVSD